MTEQQIVEFYKSHIKNTKQLGNGWYSGLCPLHDDTQSSFNFNPKSGGFHCHACAKSGSINDFRREKGIEIPQQKRRIVATYDYTNADGKLLFQTVRYGEPKNFGQRRPDPNMPGQWIYNLKGVERVIYNLPQVVSAEVVVIAEGEKDCDNLSTLGLTATTSPMGAGKWRAEYNKYFHGKHVVILPDNDKPGQDHAEKIAAALAGVALSIKIVHLPGLSEKQDVSDFIEGCRKAGSTGEAIRAEIQQLIDQAPEYEPAEHKQVEPTAADTGNVVILGMTNENKVVFYSRDTKSMIEIDPNAINDKTIVILYGLQFLNKLQAGDDKQAVKKFTLGLIDEARHTRTGSKEKIGQGIHKVQENKILIVNGQDAYTLDRNLHIEEVNTPLFQDKIIAYSGLKWFNQQCIEQARNMTSVDACSILKDLADTIEDRFSLARENDSDLLAASLVCNILQSVFSWRSHFYISGRRASGKSTFIKFIADLIGPLALLRENKISEAGLRQDIAHDRRCIFIDEFEKNPHRQAIIELLRTGNHSDGGVVTKGTPGGKPLHFRIQSSAWLSSIEVGLRDAADLSRFIVFDFKGYKKGLPPARATNELSLKIYALALWLWARGVDKIADAIRMNKDDTFIDRSSDNYSSAVAVIGLVKGDTDYSSILHFLMSQNDDTLSKNQPQDEAELLNSILGAIFTIEDESTHVTRRRDMTVAEIIESDNEEYWRQLERAGVKVIGTNEPGNYYLCFAQDPLKATLLRETRYRDLGLKEILARLPGAETGKNYMTLFARTRRNMVKVPYTVARDDVQDENA